MDVFQTMTDAEYIYCNVYGVSHLGKKSLP